MTAEPVPVERLTYDEYVKFEHLSEVRHEFVGGQVYAMSGGTEVHDLVAQAVFTRLSGAFRAKGCRTFVFNRNLRVGEDGYYPDVLVTCNPVAHRHYETDATWIVEVSSPSTEDHDRREKSISYGRLPSLQGYLLIDPEMELVRLGRPTAQGWEWYQYGPRHVVDLDGVPLDLGEVFAEVREIRVTG
jgi:Uma2 family endonuclease